MEKAKFPQKVAGIFFYKPDKLYFF